MEGKQGSYMAKRAKNNGLRECYCCSIYNRALSARLLDTVEAFLSSPRRIRVLLQRLKSPLPLYFYPGVLFVRCINSLRINNPLSSSSPHGVLSRRTETVRVNSGPWSQKQVLVGVCN